MKTPRGSVDVEDRGPSMGGSHLPSIFRPCSEDSEWGNEDDMAPLLAGIPGYYGRVHHGSSSSSSPDKSALPVKLPTIDRRGSNSMSTSVCSNRSLSQRMSGGPHPPLTSRSEVATGRHRIAPSPSCPQIYWSETEDEILVGSVINPNLDSSIDQHVTVESSQGLKLPQIFQDTSSQYKPSRMTARDGDMRSHQVGTGREPGVGHTRPHESCSDDDEKKKKSKKVKKKPKKQGSKDICDSNVYSYESVQGKPGTEKAQSDLTAIEQIACENKNISHGERGERKKGGTL